MSQLLIDVFPLLPKLIFLPEKSRVLCYLHETQLLSVQRHHLLTCAVKHKYTALLMDGLHY